MKIALISHVLPPSGSGQALMIQRMLGCLSPESYCLISTEQADPYAAGRGDEGGLPGNLHRLAPPPRIERGHRFPLLREGVNIPLAVASRARRIGEIVRREGCAAVVACTGDVTLLPAGYAASRRARVPFYPYIFDHYSYRECEDRAAAFWARRFEPWLLKGAAAVIVPNEVLADDLREHYGVESVVIHNSFDISPYEAARGQAAPARDGEVRIVYTGQIYDAHLDAFRNLIAAVESLGRPEIKLHVYTNVSTESLSAQGIRGPVVYHPYRDVSEMPRIQMEADVLFLPLAFRSPYPGLVRTSATTKLGEYMAARRPVLVHAPPDSFVSWYFRRHDCGVVVDESDPALLAKGVERILDDEGLRRRLTENAWRLARTDFSISTARAAFAGLLGLEGARRC